MRKIHIRVALSAFGIFFFLAVVVLNALSVTRPIGGKSPGQISDQYPNLFVPAGFTFSIWGIIYVLLAIYVAYSLFDSIRKADRSYSFVDTIGILFIVSCLGNVGWVVSWQLEVVPLSLAFMLVLLVSLVLIYNRLGIGKANVRPTERYLVHLPVSVYLGWITIATMANVTALVVAYRWDGFGLSDALWAVAMIVIALVLALVMLFVRKDIFYGLVVDWAVLGMLIKQTPSGHETGQAVTITAIIVMCILTVAIVLQIARGKIYV